MKKKNTKRIKDERFRLKFYTIKPLEFDVLRFLLCLTLEHKLDLLCRVKAAFRAGLTAHYAKYLCLILPSHIKVV